jgi:hypothetical protein
MTLKDWADLAQLTLVPAILISLLGLWYNMHETRKQAAERRNVEWQKVIIYSMLDTVPEGWRSKRRTEAIAPWTELEGPDGMIAAIVPPIARAQRWCCSSVDGVESVGAMPRVARPYPSNSFGIPSGSNGMWLLEALSAIRRAFELYFTVNPITMLRGARCTCRDQPCRWSGRPPGYRRWPRPAAPGSP